MQRTKCTALITTIIAKYLAGKVKDDTVGKPCLLLVDKLTDGSRKEYAFPFALHRH